MRNSSHNLILLSWPLALAQMANAIGGIASSAILAQLSIFALAATLPATMLACSITAFFSSFLAYSGTLVAQYDGNGHSDAAISSFSNGLLLALCLLPIFLACLPLGWILLSSFGHPPETLAAERIYFGYLLASGYTSTLSGVLGGFLNGLGNTRFPGIVIALGNILAVALLPFLALGSHPLSGIHGAGIANLLANLSVTAVLSYRVTATLTRIKKRSHFTTLCFNRKRLAELVRLGLPCGLRQLLDCGGFFMFTALVARLDPITTSASTALFTVNNLHHAVREGIQQATEILIGRLSSRNDFQRLRKTFTCAQLLMAFAMAVFTSILLLWREPIFHCFIPNSNVKSWLHFISTVNRLIPILLLNLLFEAIAMTLVAVHKGLGLTQQLLKLQTVSTAFVWMPLVLLVCVKQLSIEYYWITLPCCSTILSLLLASNLKKEVDRQRN